MGVIGLNGECVLNTTYETGFIFSSLMSTEPYSFSEFSNLDLRFGQALTLIPNPSIPKETFSCQLIGCIPEEAILIGPDEQGILPQLSEGQPVVVRAKLATGVALFHSVVLFVGEEPTILVYLDYPKSIKFKEVRGAIRVQVVFPVLLENVSDSNVGIVTGKACDISASGACIETEEELGRVGETVEVKGKFHVADMQRRLKVDTIIRSRTLKDGCYTYGLEFKSCDEDSLLVLFGFLFHAMFSKKIQTIS